ncbi:MAG: bifunctional oligoribonuclease/PAP phosphatase NrnA [Erysipelotrichaceae bacterium]|nr:bifunctional oligoribonuclease/PAP phosphatase NrnA [Erysipelotrichaceae bacterium]
MKNVEQLRKIKEIIEENDYIVIYRHIKPDYDAFGSQLSLNRVLKLNYPEKHIYTYGKETIDNPPFIPPMDNPADEILGKCLAIMVDTSNKQRIDDDSHVKCKAILKIDHHPAVDDYGFFNYVDTEASSCSQIISELIQVNGWKMDHLTAQYIYAGMSTDTLKMTIDNCDWRLFEDMAFITNKDNIGRRFDINGTNRIIYDMTMDLFKAQAALSQKVVFIDDTAYLYVMKKDMDELHITLEQSKDMIHLMEHIVGVDKWLLFMEEDDHINCSLRSHSTVINDIAAKFRGGGHPFASGAAKLSYEETQEIIRLVAERK